MGREGCSPFKDVEIVTVEPLPKLQKSQKLHPLTQMQLEQKLHYG